MPPNIIGRQVRRELEVENEDGSIGEEVLIGTIVSYSDQTTYYEVDYNDGGECEEFTYDECVGMLIGDPPRPPERERRTSFLPDVPGAAGQKPPSPLPPKPKTPPMAPLIPLPQAAQQTAARPQQLPSLVPPPPMTMEQRLEEHRRTVEHPDAREVPTPKPDIWQAPSEEVSSSRRSSQGPSPHGAYADGGAAGPSGAGYGGPPLGTGYGGAPPGTGYGGPPPGTGYGGPPPGTGYGGAPPRTGYGGTARPMTSMTQAGEPVSEWQAQRERLIGRKIKNLVKRVIEGPEGPSGEEEFEMVGFVSFYDPVSDEFTCEYEDQGTERFTYDQLQKVILPDEMTRIEEELRQEREAIRQERERVKLEGTEQERQEKAQADAHVAAELERNAAARAEEVKVAQEKLDREHEERDEQWLAEKERADQALLEELHAKVAETAMSAEQAKKQMKDEMDKLKYLIDQASSTAVAKKKEKMSVKKDIADLAKEQEALQERLTDEERAIMQMARQKDEELRASIRDIHAQYEQDIAAMKQSTEDEMKYIHRMQMDKEEEYEREQAANVELMRNAQVDSHKVLDSEIKTQVKVRDNVEREKLQVVSELANIQEQNKLVLLNLKKEEEVVAKIRIELEEERTKANQQTLEKIRLTARQVQRIKDAQNRLRDRAKMVEAELDPYVEKVDGFADTMGEVIMSYRGNLEQQLGEVRADAARIKKKVAEDVKLNVSTLEQDLKELKAMLRERKQRSSACAIV